MNNQVFHTERGGEIHVFPITISLGNSAHIRCMILTSSGFHEKTYTLEGDDYARWGSDDEYIKNYICDKEAYLGRPIGSVDASGNPIKYIPPTSTGPVLEISDTRSVHNEADIAKIQTLQEQLDAQAVKLKTIMDLLYKQGTL